jgi:hypothetical protein
LVGGGLENGYNKSFNGKLREELLNGEIFLYSERSEDHDREVAYSLQYQKATYESGVLTGSKGNNTDSKYYYYYRVEYLNLETDCQRKSLLPQLSSKTKNCT